jgi:hypothetical protein
MEMAGVFLTQRAQSTRRRGARHIEHTGTHFGRDVFSPAGTDVASPLRERRASTARPVARRSVRKSRLGNRVIRRLYPLINRQCTHATGLSLFIGGWQLEEYV